MNVDVLFFAGSVDIFGERQLVRALDAGATVGRLIEELVGEFPAFARLSEVVSVAVNAEYVGHDQALVNGDEVAIIPPVSGG